MNCEKLSDIIGMRCNQLDSSIEVLTPFTFSDGNGIELFAQEHGPQIHFFDDGFTLLHLHSVGISLNNKMRWLPLRGIAENYGVTLSDDGVFETLSSISNPSNGFARMVAALIGIAAWEREQIGVSADTALLVDEVALYLRAWKPSLKLLERPSIKGFSGRSLTFDFEFGDQYIDAVHPHFASTGAELRKLVDFNSASVAANKEALVIVDDRNNPDLAKQEIGIIGRVAKTWPMSSLMVASGIAISPSLLYN